jgi:3-oxoacyl-[acyl-carrier protein] reductase
MELGLSNKIVLVTGASKGIGKAIAEAFAAEGSKVAIAARGAEELQRTASEISKGIGTEVMGVTADMSKAEDISSAIGEVVKRFGTIHVLVNNAGGVQAFACFNDLTDDDWLAVLNLNLMSAVRSTPAVVFLASERASLITGTNMSRGWRLGRESVS